MMRHINEALEIMSNNRQSDFWTRLKGIQNKHYGSEQHDCFIVDDSGSFGSETTSTEYMKDSE
jgi:hypothetical protein